MQMLLVMLNLMGTISTGPKGKDKRLLGWDSTSDQNQNKPNVSSCYKTLFLQIRDMAGALMSLQEGSSCYPGSGTLGANYPLAVTVQDSWK